MSELRSTLNELAADIKQLTATSIKNEEQLRYHIKRTDLLEESVTLLRQQFTPVAKHVALVNSLCKVTVGLLGLLATVITILAGLGALR